MCEAALVDVWTTSRKVYAEGARMFETPLRLPPSALVDKGQATVSLPQSRRARRKMYRRLNYGAVKGFGPLCYDTSDPQTLEYAFRKRLMRDVPVPAPGALDGLSVFVQNFLNQYVPKVQPMEFDAWLESTMYGDVRKAELRGVHDELRGGFPTRRQCESVSAFPKTEPYANYSKCQRMINSRSDYFKVFSGPCFKAIEKVVYELSWFIKHVPVPDRPKLVGALRAANRHYYQTDFKAFESHFTPDVMESIELLLYRHCLWDFKGAGLIIKTLRGKNRMKTRSGVRAVCEARRMSGDMCTSLGNGFSNLMLALYIMSRKGGKLEGFVEGDDGLFATTVPLCAEDYLDLGFTIEIEEVDDPCSASFCGLVFSDSGQIIRDPVKFLNRFGWTHSFIHAGPKIMNELLNAKALSTSFETPHCPIVGAIARHALKLTAGYCPRFVPDGYHEAIPADFRVPEFAPTLDTRLLFERLYGVPPALQIWAEGQIAEGNIDCVTSLFNAHPDVEDYTERYVVCT